MAIGWIRLIRSVPWEQVVRKAPEIADLAKKLWNTTYNRAPTTEIDVSANPNSQTIVNPSSYFTDDQRIASLEEKLTVMEATSARQHQQLMESLELITGLAEQNTQLVKTIEVNRVRLLRLTAFTVLIGIVAAFSLFFALR